jgi:hypothetical protein
MPGVGSEMLERGVGGMWPVWQVLSSGVRQRVRLSLDAGRAVQAKRRA